MHPANQIRSSVWIPTMAVLLVFLTGGILPAAAAEPSKPWFLADEVWGPLDPQIERAATGTRRRCDDSDPASCGALKLFYSRSAGELEQEPERVGSIYRLACEDGVAWGCLDLAELASTGLTGESPGILVQALLERSCGAGESRACVELGARLESGDGLPVDRVRAESLYRSECEAGRAAGCWRLALLQMEEERHEGGEEADPVQCNLERACTGGIAAACRTLGDRYAASEVEAAQAAHYYGLACDRRDPEGCIRFADHLVSGEGSNKDPHFAAKLYRQACQAGRGDACRKLVDLEASQNLPKPLLRECPGQASRSTPTAGPMD